MPKSYYDGEVIPPGDYLMGGISGCNLAIFEVTAGKWIFTPERSGHKFGIAYGPLLDLPHEWGTGPSDAHEYGWVYGENEKK